MVFGYFSILIVLSLSHQHSISMKNLIILFSIFSLGIKAQSGYDIKINFKGNKDTLMYLVKYLFDQQYIADTSKKIKNGQVQFKGKTDLDKGVYTLVSQEKSIYFDFFINENQKFTINTDMSDIVGSLKSVGNKENEQFFSYIKYITGKNADFGKLRDQTKGKSKEDSTKFMNEKLKILNDEVKKFDKDFMEKSKGTYVYDVLNLKSEKEPEVIPKASNGRNDSVYQYYYYKNHFFDGIDFKDDRIVRTPFFDDRIKKYFESVIVQHPDTVYNEMDKVLKKCVEGSLVYNLLLGHFTYKAEQSKIMGFDKVFVKLAENYIVPGKAKGVYTEETVKKIEERYKILKDLLLDAKVSELYMIDTTYAKQVMKMGFDTAKTSKSVTDLYYKNLEKLTPMFKTLYQTQAKYTVLVFWASDCGHCQTELPKLKEGLDKLNGKIDFKVYSVQTKENIDEWKKFIIDKKIDFINVFDPIHLNNLKEKFDINSTPVIYILDREKKIKAKKLASEQVPEMLNMLENIEKNENKK
jgi:thiol-disulfide isomerase/thioredoxin